MSQDDPILLPPEEFEAQALKKAEEFIEADEGAMNKFGGWLGGLIIVMGLGMTLFHLYAAVEIVPTQSLRPIHVAMVLFLIFLLYPTIKRLRHRVMPWDLVCAALSVGVVTYMLLGGDDFTDRNTSPNQWDKILGVALILLILEAARRTSGWIMPFVCILFIAYAAAGPYLPAPWTHRGYDVDRMVGHMYMTLEGVFGSAIDVSSSLIILFTIYGAILAASGAGKFFIDFSFSALGGKSSSAGRAVVVSSFLLGGPSGSGVATTVTLGAVAFPLLAKAGYDKNAAGGMLAAGGMGAILSPPVLGAAAFLIAEYLKISYLDVILMATIPTLLYYFSLLLMVEIDARKYHGIGGDFGARQSLIGLLRRSGYHFTSLISIVVFMFIGFSPILSVFWATVLAVAVSYLNRQDALMPRRLISALSAGSIGMLNVGATCAAAGIIVGIVTLTGLGLKFSAIIIDYAGGNLLLTAVYTALIVWVVGLAVPVTASYIICAVIAAPAMIKLGVPDFAAHMFIFYYAVLSEVSPPTALSPFAAAAMTGGDPYKTTLQSWKYTLPAFIVPFAFVLEPAGIGLLLKTGKNVDWLDVVWLGILSVTGIASLAGAAQARLLVPNRLIETVFFALGGGFLVVPTTLTEPLRALFSVKLPYAWAIGLILALLALTLQIVRMRALGRGHKPAPA